MSCAIRLMPKRVSLTTTRAVRSAIYPRWAVMKSLTAFTNSVVAGAAWRRPTRTARYDRNRVSSSSGRMAVPQSSKVYGSVRDTTAKGSDESTRHVTGITDGNIARNAEVRWSATVNGAG